MIASFILVHCMVGAPDAQTPQDALPLRVVAPWVAEVGPGTLTPGEREIALPRSVQVAIAPPLVIEVEDELHPALRVYDPEAGGWRRGERLKKLMTEECTATGLLHPDSLVVKATPDSEPYQQGVDYDLDPFWATVGRLEGGAIAEDQSVHLDYTYSPCRLDSIIVNDRGEVRLIPGTPGVGAMEPPSHADNETAIANIWVPGDTEALTEENLYSIEHGVAQASVDPTAERLLPKTLAKLRAGEPVTIVAWGDSVTNGGGVTDDRPSWYQHQFHARLRDRFPDADIQLLTAAWGGSSSKRYMDAPPGGEHDFVRDVLDPKPDLVTIEFVNDAYLDDPGVQAHYGLILEKLQSVGAEVILITPHLVRPDWMQVEAMKFDEDPRPYVVALRRFAAENDIAVAEASPKWCRLWRQGIPYITLEANSINHPDARGHALFADALMEVFPAR
jgi:lysophospholipase L1-like esterase